MTCTFEQTIQQKIFSQSNAREVISQICQEVVFCEDVCYELQRLTREPSDWDFVKLASRKYVDLYFSAARTAQICSERLSTI